MEQCLSFPGVKVNRWGWRLFWSPHVPAAQVVLEETSQAESKVLGTRVHCSVWAWELCKGQEKPAAAGAEARGLLQEAPLLSSSPSHEPKPRLGVNPEPSPVQNCPW